MGNRGFGAAWAKETLADPVPSLGQDKRFSGFIPESKCQYPQLGLRRTAGIVRSGSLTTVYRDFKRLILKTTAFPHLLFDKSGPPWDFSPQSKVHVPARMFECDEGSDERSDFTLDQQRSTLPMAKSRWR
jgi:hypothetical protein